MWTAFAMVLLAALATGQAQQQYLDVYIAQVKPEKRADFDALSKKMVAANRQNKGDSWIAMETVYGRGDRVTFISTRNSDAESDKGTEMFNQALQKTYGQAAADKMMRDYSQCMANVRVEFRLRRWDLSSNAPADAAAMAKMLGNTRWLRTTAVHVRPGQVAVFEALLKELKAAREKASPPQTALVSQAVAGQEGTVLYVTSMQTSMAGFDAIPTMPHMLGEEGYAKFLKTNAEVVEGTETVISHFLPELSNVPEDVAAAAPDYWRPKTAMGAKASPAKSGETPQTGRVADDNQH